MNHGPINGDALEAFSQFASQFDTDGDDWQDMGSDEYFVAGYEAGVASTRSADDDEAVTEAWLHSVGFVTEGDGPLRCYRVSSGWFASIEANDQQAATYGTDSLTRGRVRLFCKSLGIALKETK